MRTIILISFFSFFSEIAWAQRMDVVSFRSEQYRQQLQFLIYEPQKTKNSKQPLLIFLHGSDGVGEDLSALKSTGIPKLIVEGKNFPFMIIAPHLDHLMDKVWTPRLVDEFVSYALKHYNVDPDRVSITGISIGGTGVWEYTSAFPEKIACAVPIAGWGSPQKVCQMKNVPTWAFHGSADKVVGIAGSKNMTESLRRCNGLVKLTELPNVGHDAWRETYSYPQLIEWISYQSKSTKKNQLTLNSYTIAYSLPRALAEVTGLCYDQQGTFFGVVAKNNLPAVISFDTTSHATRLTLVQNAANVSWQDIISLPDGYTYILDAGNEQYHRKEFQLYKILTSDLRSKDRVTAERIPFYLPDGYMCDMKNIFSIEGSLYTFVKTQNAETYVMRLPIVAGGWSAALQIVDCFKLNQLKINSSVYDAEKKTFYLLTNDKIYELASKDGLAGLRDVTPRAISLATISQKEGITLLPDKRLIYVDQYFSGANAGNLYIVDLENIAYRR